MAGTNHSWRLRPRFLWQVHGTFPRTRPYASRLRRVRPGYAQTAAPGLYRGKSMDAGVPVRGCKPPSIAAMEAGGAGDYRSLGPQDRSKFECPLWVAVSTGGRNALSLKEKMEWSYETRTEPGF